MGLRLVNSAIHWLTCLRDERVLSTCDVQRVRQCVGRALPSCSDTDAHKGSHARRGRCRQTTGEGGGHKVGVARRCRECSVGSRG